ncbi:MAG: uracil-DNA glycosylase [Alphaproteobacteria bacterium]|nr:uracil-DNA glycosylase [Alphaproteobacteria bacterium]
MKTPPHEPAAACGDCPRLVTFRRANRRAFPDFHNAPVAAFGALDARLLIVGLAPGLKGANRTGRPFTGDHAGDLLYPTLLAHGFAAGSFGRQASDGLRLIDCRVTNAVRCVPPGNKPTGNEIATCRGFLRAEIRAMPRLGMVLALGLVAHRSVLKAMGATPSPWPFRHGALHHLPGGPILADSYHCSRYNTNTGRLTPAMFADVIASLRRALDG